MIRFLFFLFALLGSVNVFGAQNRKSSAPYVSGDTFRAYADFVIDETKIRFSPSSVKPGNTIFLKTDYLERFFKELHPLIRHPYILITHNSDDPAPGAFAHMLDDPKLIAWFAQNVENCTHPKLHPIPIGIANQYWPHGNPAVFSKVREDLKRHARSSTLYMNFSVSTHLQERSLVHNAFIDKPFCVSSAPKKLDAYLSDLTMSKFVLSPRGNGLDCHRTWEALYMGAIPIVRSSSLDAMYEGLPVIIVNDWSEVTLPFLEKKYAEMQEQTFQSDRMFCDYWFKLIDSYKVGYRNENKWFWFWKK